MDSERKSIFIGIPCYDTVAPEILQDYMRFTYYLGRRYTQYDFYLGIKTKSEQFRARNEIVKAALDVGADYLLQIDDDMVIDWEDTQFPINKYQFLQQLINHLENNPKMGLVGCLYYERGNLCRPVLMKKITPTNYEWLTDTDITGRLQQVDVQGGGVMLINMKVFDWIPGPTYFEPEYIYGTDVQICRKVQEAGFTVFCDTSIEFGHLRSQRLIVTSQNRKDLLSMAKDQDDQTKSNCNYGRIVNQYREDIKEFLGIDEKLASDAYLEYEDWQLKFHDYADPNQWYIDSSKCFLTRQVIVNNPEKPSAHYINILSSVGSEKKFNGLDFACGSSPVGFELNRQGHNVLLLDLPGTENWKFLEWRHKKYNLPDTQITTLDGIEDGSLDFICALDCIEHFKPEEIPGLLARLTGLLKNHGMMYCNFLVNTAFDFPEHLFMDKVLFMRLMAENYMMPISHFQFMKDHTYFEEK